MCDTSQCFITYESTVYHFSKRVGVCAFRVILSLRWGIHKFRWKSLVYYGVCIQVNKRRILCLVNAIVHVSQLARSTRKCICTRMQILAKYICSKQCCIPHINHLVLGLGNAKFHVSLTPNGLYQHDSVPPLCHVKLLYWFALAHSDTMFGIDLSLL